ncbi:hypothetical protein [Paracoccus benzoatiresistens]|uniref:Acyloxyacyl hydrolase n=1 Tax=Paracoccus benzoatiresistens TaxID=2997341 RepID=A0ABT4J360_9RHOB|nr:hypothetical protein [Paracoccus sp. EF6]MCZ0961047.1 hypothetical protein [Paracoccus sp. EF6]
MKKLKLAGAALCLIMAQPLSAQEEKQLHERNIFVFTGRMMDEDIGQSLNVLGGDYEDNYITGLGYQDFFLRARRIDIGYELGAAKRYGDDSTAEIWAGLVARVEDIHLAENLFFSPSIVIGLSHVDAIHAGREERLEEKYEGDASLVFYFSPEIDFKLSPQSRYSFFWRLHHRSGAWRTLGNMKGASNANVFGIRMRF